VLEAPVVSDSFSSEDSDTDVGVSAHVDSARKYHVLMEIGRGGTAIVSCGIARGIAGFTKLVVLKTILEEFLTDRETVRMFIDEACLSARMNHPNVVQVYEVYSQNRLPVIVMEFLDGQSLARVHARAFEDPAYTTAIAVSILCKVLAGLQYAHSLTDYDGTPLELVHRDVSPHNVMLTYDGQVKLVDFGIAKLRFSSQNTKTGVVKGKIGYMAREQVEGGKVDHRGDLFAVGVMLWEAIARRRLWGTRSDAQVVRCLVLDDVPSIQSAVPDVDPELARICATALAANVDARYASAAQFQADLEEYLRQRALNVHQQDIANLVVRTCADHRDESAARLRTELAKFAANSPGWEDALASFDDLLTPAPLRRSRSKWWLLVLCSVFAFGTGALALSQVSRPEPAPALSPTASPAPSAAVSPTPREPAPTQVSLRVMVKPEHAIISLDGKRLPASPLSISLPRDDAEHVLRAEADGFEPQTQKVWLGGDLDLNLELKPQPLTLTPAAVLTTKPRPSRPARPSRLAKPEEPRAFEISAPAVVDCNPPYTIDAAGMKHYRLECL
jgi:serine/threonine protein kinase